MWTSSRKPRQIRDGGISPSLGFADFLIEQRPGRGRQRRHRRVGGQNSRRRVRLRDSRAARWSTMAPSRARPCWGWQQWRSGGGAAAGSSIRAPPAFVLLGIAGDFDRAGGEVRAELVGVGAHRVRRAASLQSRKLPAWKVRRSPCRRFSSSSAPAWMPLGKVMGRFRTTGIRPRFAERLKQYGMQLPAFF